MELSKNAKKLKQDFSNLKFLNIEIRQYAREIAEIETLATHCTQSYEDADMPKGGGSSDKVSDCVADIAEVSEIIAYALKKREKEYMQVFNQIQSIEDAEIRSIAFLRYVRCLDWNDTAKEMGELELKGGRKGYNTARIKMKLTRYFQSIE